MGLELIASENDRLFITSLAYMGGWLIDGFQILKPSQRWLFEEITSLKDRNAPEWGGKFRQFGKKWIPSFLHDHVLLA